MVVTALLLLATITLGPAELKAGTSLIGGGECMCERPENNCPSECSSGVQNDCAGNAPDKTYTCEDDDDHPCGGSAGGACYSYHTASGKDCPL
jgi:hypothetical protein